MDEKPAADGSPPWLVRYLELERAAEETRTHLPNVVAGLFQTPDYATGIARSVGLAPQTEEYVQRVVRQRRERQSRVLSGELRVTVIQSESSLRLQICDAAGMAAQMARLIEFSELPNVTLYVTPSSVGQYEALRIGSYAILIQRGTIVAAHLEGYDGGRLTDETSELDYLSKAFEHAKARALPLGESRQFIDNLRQEWLSTAHHRPPDPGRAC